MQHNMHRLVPDPPVSIVLTTFNRAGLLERTVETIQRQTFADFEVLILDDCSEDHTADVASRLAEQDGRVRYIRHPRRLGMPRNLNEGIKAARGDYIANLHDGDLYDPHLLEKWKSALDACPLAAFVFNAYAVVDVVENADHAVQVYRENLATCFPGGHVLEQIFYRRWRFGSPVWGTTMVRRWAYERHGLFSERFGFVADVDMWMRLAEQHHVAYVPEPLIRVSTHRVAPRQWTETASELQRHLEHMFWESRLRHYRHRPLRLVCEVQRRLLFVAACRAYQMACRSKWRLFRRMTKSVPTLSDAAA